MTGEGLWALPLTLTSLDLGDLGDIVQVERYDDWCALVRLTALNGLGLSSCRFLPDFGMEQVASLTALTSLDLYQCDISSDIGMRLVASLNALTALTDWDSVPDASTRRTLDTGGCI